MATRRIREVGAFYDSEHVAKELGVSLQHLRRLVRDGKSPVPFYRVGKQLRFPKPPLDRMIAGDTEWAS